jgi:hypothetical protein
MFGLKILRNVHIQANEVISISKQLRFYVTITNKLANAADYKRNSTEPLNRYYDIVVCGGGIVGTSMASALGN